MKAPQFYVSIAIGFVCLGLSITLITLGQANQRLQTRLQQQQEAINEGNSNQQGFQRILHDLAEISTHNENVKDLLARNGFTVKTDSSSPASGPASASRK